MGDQGEVHIPLGRRQLAVGGRRRELAVRVAKWVRRCVDVGRVVARV